jgi:hypothetical protein
MGTEDDAAMGRRRAEEFLDLLGAKGFAAAKSRSDVS